MSPTFVLRVDEPIHPLLRPASKSDGSAYIYTVPDLGMVIDMREIIGPFILSFNLELFLMGVVLILSINYFVYIQPVVTRPGYGRSTRTLETWFISVSLVFSLAGSLTSLFKAWDIFASHALDPLYTYNLTAYTIACAFLGAFPTVLNQVFLTMRAFRFLGHSQFVLPRLSRELVRYTFVVIVGLAILGQCIGNFAETILAWKAKTLFNLGHDMPLSQKVYNFSLVFAISAVSADILIALVLTGQLWLARRELDSNLTGGTTRRVLQRLMLVIFPSGLLQAIMQVSQLICYKHAIEWTLFPISLLPKVYNITLILAISAPHIIDPPPTLSNVQLPTIHVGSTARDSPRGQVVSRKRRSKHFTGDSWRSGLRRVLGTTRGKQYPSADGEPARRSVGRYSKHQDEAAYDEKHSSSGATDPSSISAGELQTALATDPNAVTSYQSSAHITSNGSLPDSVLFWRPPISPSVTPAETSIKHGRRRSDSAAARPDISHHRMMETLKAKEREDETRMTASSPAAVMVDPRAPVLRETLLPTP